MKCFFSLSLSPFLYDRRFLLRLRVHTAYTCTLTSRMTHANFVDDTALPLIQETISKGNKLLVSFFFSPSPSRSSGYTVCTSMLTVSHTGYLSVSLFLSMFHLMFLSSRHLIFATSDQWPVTHAVSITLLSQLGWERRCNMHTRTTATTTTARGRERKKKEESTKLLLQERVMREFILLDSLCGHFSSSPF